MIYTVSGDLGSGKSLWCLDMMHKAVQAGRPVYTNITLLPACPYYDDVALIDTKESPVLRGTPKDRDYCAWWHYVEPGALVVIDEADLYLDCSEHSDVGKDMKAAHKMIRKIGWDVIYIVQNIPNLNVRLRRLTSRFIVCEHNFRTAPMFKFLTSMIGYTAAMGMSRFLRSEFGAEDLSPRSHRQDGYYTYKEAMRFFGWYETKQLLGDLSWRRDRFKQSLNRDDDGASGVLRPTG